MQYLSHVLLTAAVLLCVPWQGFAQEIMIGEIVENTRISGRVANLPSAGVEKYKVVVYVQTDKWYIHPYAGQGENLSWASVKSDGTWEIETVKRRFSAKKVAALLVSKGLSPPDTAGDISTIPCVTKTIRILTNTSDYGKL
jgi:hypothetical protein